ncbi:MAG: hypothetical protein LBI29_00595 [Rickettsiales bacterium]|nr:hypothetical protein [Rickettsiales bacterium]
MNARYKKHYNVKHSDDVFANGRVYVNGIDNFWGIAKSRLSKIREVKFDKLNLHLKKTKWRFDL